jgi:hypothetical protein
MTVYRKLELAAGFGSAVLGIFILVLPERGNLLEVAKPPDNYFKFFIWVCPELLVAGGAYFHVVKRKQWGRLLLLVSGVIPGVFTLLILPSFGQLVYLTGVTAFLVLATGCLTILTMILSLVREAP